LKGIESKVRSAEREVRIERRLDGKWGVGRWDGKWWVEAMEMMPFLVGAAIREFLRCRLIVMPTR